MDITLKLFLIVLLSTKNDGCKLIFCPLANPSYDYYDSPSNFCQMTCDNIESTSTLNQLIQNITGKMDLTFSLNVTQSNFSTIEQDAFVQIPGTKHLWLAGNHIKTLSVGAFNGLRSLEALSLADNEIEELKNGVFNLTELHRLYLSNNRISKIEREAISALKNLEVLDLSSNEIVSINIQFPELSFGLYVDLSGNPITEMDINSNYALQMLVLKQTAFKEIFNWSMLTIEQLDVSEGLEKVDCRLLPQKTTILDFSSNKIWSVTHLDYITAQQIHLENNQLSGINETFSNQVEMLFLSHNRLIILEKMFRPLSNLTVLDVSYNKISTIANKAFEGLFQLVKLILNNNKISIIKHGSFKDLTHLKELNLSKNSIEKLRFGVFAPLIKLEQLDLSGNKLKALDEHSLHSLSNLKVLNFEENQISELNVADLISYSKNLKIVSLDKNLFSCQSVEAMDRYFRGHGVTVLNGSSEYGDNLRGIFCINRNEYQSGVSPDIFREMIDNSIKNSAMEAFFEKYFTRGRNLNRDLDGEFSITSVTNTVILAILTLTVVFFCYMYLKRVRFIHVSSPLKFEL